jgi:hypothetical protein
VLVLGKVCRNFLPVVAYMYIVIHIIYIYIYIYIDLGFRYIIFIPHVVKFLENINSNFTVIFVISGYLFLILLVKE